MIERPTDPIEGVYKLLCTFDGKGTRILRLPQSCGLELGMLLPKDFGPASKYGCPLCRRNTTMKIIEIPEPVHRPHLKGFDRIPVR